MIKNKTPLFLKALNGETKAAELEAAFTDEVLLSYVNNAGYKP